jgi:alpha-D-xyloside xylohydrolase
MKLSTALLPLALAASASGQWIPDNPVTQVRRQADGVLLTLRAGAEKLQVCTDSIVRVRYSPSGEFPETPDYVVTKTSWIPAPFELESNDENVTLSTARLSVVIHRGDGTISYRDAQRRELLSDGPKQMRPITMQGEATYHAEDVFKMYGSEEGLYGLGQHQAGVWNYRGVSVELSQENSEIAVPLLLSSKGYGLFWNNTSVSKVNNRFIHYLYVSSDVADVIDYYFFYGPEFDKIVADYRELTGAAPLYGKWAYGFWQCKNKYKTESEILGVAHKYRELHIPLDNIVQDWFWWTTTGEFVFNKNYPDPKGMIDDLHRNHVHLMISIWPFFYPGSATYADMDKRGYFIDRTKTVSFHPKGTAVYDAFNPEARKYYWRLVDNSLFKIGADAWWMDTTEPETEGVEENVLLSNHVAAGNGARVANLFPLMTTSAVYQGQRAESSEKRVFILSRSAFAGIQRNGVTAWSGDVLSDFETYKRQIPAALNFEVSGIPYWTSDIGGFIMGHPRDPAYRELFVRWFQFGAFCPVFRVHGTRTPDENELWSYGPEAQKILVAYDKLRYRLMPYIYSLAWKVTNGSYTPMRALMMDFAGDPRVLNIGDQYMFGPAILVSPVTEQGANMRHLYLPAGAQWYDFWSGATTSGGRMVDAPAPLDRLPLYVRSGSIIPMGPDVEYTTEKPADPIELRIFPGADGDFTLYEDENDNYNYEKGVYATIPLHWDDARGALTIGSRQGSFPGMLQSRSFHVVFARPGHGTGPGLTSDADKVVRYSGQLIAVAR